MNPDESNTTPTDELDDSALDSVSGGAGPVTPLPGGALGIPNPLVKK